MDKPSKGTQGEAESGLDSDITLEQFVAAFSDPHINPELFEYDPITGAMSHPDLTFIGSGRPLGMDAIIYTYRLDSNYCCQFAISSAERRSNMSLSSLMGIMYAKARKMAYSVNRGVK